MARRLIPAAEKRAAGRPAMQPPEDAADRIRVAAAGGASMQGIAAAVGCSADVLRRWLDENAELREAIDKGREQERATLHNVLYRTATEGKGKDAIIAAMFLLKARHGYREGDISEQANRVNITFTLPGAQPMSDFVIENADGTKTKSLPASTVAATGRG